MKPYYKSFADDVAVLAAFFKGARLTVFEESLAVIEASVTAGAWLARGRQRASKGINKGIAASKSLCKSGVHACYMAAAYGWFPTRADLDSVTDADLEAIAPKVPVEVFRAWLRLLVALRSIFADLDASRPVPIYTEIGLSRKVTATLQDAGLDLDLTTRRMCPLDWMWVDATRIEDGRVVTVLDRDGKPVQVKHYFPKWPDDTVFEASRFAGCDCEACGKAIPSRMVVPVLVSDRSGRQLGFWFGRDCARNILGIKDEGLRRSVERVVR